MQRLIILFEDNWAHQLSTTNNVEYLGLRLGGRLGVAGVAVGVGAVLPLDRYCD